MAGGRVHDRDAELRRVYRVHVGAVYAFLAYSVGRDVAEDLTSATFERVLRAWHSFDATRGSERTWVLAIARNVLIDNYRRQQHRQTVSLDEHPGLIESLASSADPLAQQLSVEGLVEWLTELGPTAREILALRFGADLQTRDIAALTGHSDANVQQILSRSLRAMRERAERRARLSDSA